MARRSQIAETQPRIIVAWADDPVEVDFREGHCITSAVLQPNSDRSAGLLHLRRGDRIGAVIGGVIGAWPVVTGKPHAAERRIGRRAIGGPVPVDDPRSEEHTSELQSLMRIPYAVFCLKKKTLC